MPKEHQVDDGHLNNNTNANAGNLQLQLLDPDLNENMKTLTDSHRTAQTKDTGVGFYEPRAEGKKI